MTERSQCSVRTLQLGEQVRCTSMTALLTVVSLWGPNGEWSGRYVEYPVCSKHRFFAESRGMRAIDPAVAGEEIRR